MPKKNNYFPNKLFQILFLIYFLIGIIILFSSKKGDGVIWVNSYSNSKLDSIFIFVTFFGHGTFALLVTLLFLFKRIYYSIVLCFSFLFVSLFTNLMKHFVFSETNRPLWSIYYNDLHRVIYDAPVNYSHSFPSGHTMTAFALAAVVSMFIKSKSGAVFLFIYASLIALSRIYLLQHYFVDVFWGSVFGICAAILGKIITDKLIMMFKLDFIQLPVQKNIIKLLKNSNT